MVRKQAARGLGLVHREESENLSGVVAKVIYFNEESLYCVASLETGKGAVVVTGNLGRVKPGENLVLTGRFQNHAQYGRQFQAGSFKVILPQEEEGIKAYLGSGLVKGLGPALAGRIVDRFKAETLEVMDQNPELLLEVEGIGPKKLKQIKKAREERREMEGLGLFLRSHDLPASLTVRLYKKYGNRALALVRDNPYMLIRDMAGIGFKKADNIAMSLGLGQDSDQRLTAGLLHVLRQAAEQGDCYLLDNDLLNRASRLLETGREKAAQGLEVLIQTKRVEVEEVAQASDPSDPCFRTIYLPQLYEAEKTVARGILDLLKGRGPLKGVKPGPVLARIARESALEFSPEQEEALQSVFSSKVMVITGGPGTGKTTLIRALVQLFLSQEIAPALAAPTGRAAKRLSLSAGEPASTIHRLLEYTPQEGFKRNQDNRLPHKAVLIDEVSMVDVQLMASLVQALRPGASLVLIGDADQLPAVGPGQVLDDLIKSEQIKVVRLVKIFRQSEGSTIVANAHRIRQGQPLLREEVDDFYFIDQEDPARAAEIIIKLVAERIPGRFGLDPFQEIQVLSPMRKGVCGVEALNAELRQALNPLGKNLGNTGFRLGDKVIQTRNNYERMTFNGDLGLIRGQVGKGQLMIDMEGEAKVYEGEGLAELVLAYCLSIHKAQGSEYPAVVIPILPEHTIMLRRNLIYTALTRARSLAVMVGSPKALHAALGRSRGDRRRTLLARRIREGRD